MRCGLGTVLVAPKKNPPGRHAQASTLARLTIAFSPATIVHLSMTEHAIRHARTVAWSRHPEEPHHATAAVDDELPMGDWLLRLHHASISPYGVVESRPTCFDESSTPPNIHRSRPEMSSVCIVLLTRTTRLIDGAVSHERTYCTLSRRDGPCATRSDHLTCSLDARKKNRNVRHSPANKVGTFVSSWDLWSMSLNAISNREFVALTLGSKSLNYAVSLRSLTIGHTPTTCIHRSMDGAVHTYATFMDLEKETANAMSRCFDEALHHELQMTPPTKRTYAQ
nr:hypothetical protein CFP56_22495 [Quercus suber]